MHIVQPCSRRSTAVTAPGASAFSCWVCAPCCEALRTVGDMPSSCDKSAAPKGVGNLEDAAECAGCSF
jgi:hypothetical protein